MKRLVTVFGLFCFFVTAAHSQQVDCATIGFESGSALGWVLTSGTLNAANNRVNYLNETMQTVENGHFITQLITLRLLWHWVASHIESCF